MGAALHLAHVQQTPVRKRKRKGGGSGGDGYDALVARVYQDQRMTPEARELILLLAWLAVRDPNRYDSDGNFINWRKRASAILDKDSPTRQSRLADLVYADRPRYEDKRDGWEQRTCAAPMIRRAGLCGQHAVGHDYTVDQETGWRTAVWYCRRHEPWGRDLRTQRLANPGPEPIPNAGGLVTSYLMTEGEGQEKSWARLYKEAAVWHYDPHWEPPKTYGVVADNWPVPGKDPVPQRARLRLVLGGQDLEDV
ncbi:hypothetical protein [Streptomyces violaceus]|uniref:Uncharacterized protein n=1 Tax=Streptomyces violaceus TaxID=1936 RepID=A0ABY9UNZ8_STRVL|nr:hypothetical protein [Streptomyces janthinus]WND24064.1 hypothetical protein RI060_42860 [Streptomyces janthinus]GGS96483.1 hypothetical protein GCM10010270_80580 [Streptomyces janthinus]